MNNLLRIKSVVVILLLAVLPATAQLTVTTQNDPLILAQKILGTGVKILNPQFSGHSLSAGTFSAVSGSFLLDSGIVLTTGRAKTNGTQKGVDGPASAFASVAASNTGDADLTAYSGKTTKDACILEFDFIPQGDSINVRYVFGSEEYPQFVCSPFNDVFGFFISGPGFFGLKNIATVPDAPTTTPVTINSINSGVPGSGYPLSNCQAWPGAPFTQHFVDNSGGTTVTYNGHTVVLTAKIKVTPCQTYHIKLAIADATDQVYDSGVFIEANSFTSKRDFNASVNGPLLDAGNNVTMVEACKTAEIKLTRAQDIIGPFTVVTTYSGTATPGVDYTTLPATISFSATDQVKTFTISAIADAFNEGTEKAILRFSKNTCTTQFADSVTVYIVDSLVNRSKKDTSFCSVTPLTISGKDTVAGVINSYLWNNGATTQTLNVTQAGTYYVTHIYSQRCFNIDTFAVVLNDPTLTVNNTSFQICAGDSVALAATTNANTLTWNTGAYTNSIMAYAAGQYWVKAKNTIGCEKSDTITVTIKPSPVVYLGRDTSICGNNAVVLDAFYPGATYLWSTGATSASITATTTGNYSVVSTLNGCTAKDTITVNVSSVPAVNLGNDTTICQNKTLQLSALYTGAAYIWNTGATSSSITVNNAGQYSVINNLNGCIAKDTINVTVQPAPVFDLGADTSICANQNLQLNAFSPLATYAWNTGASSSSINVNTTGKYVVVSTLNGCNAIDSINVTVKPLPVVNLGKDTTICQNKTLQLNALYTGATYAWNTGATSSSIIVNNTGQYAVVSTLSGCMAKDTINVTVQAIPVFDLGADTSICADKTLQLNAFSPSATYVWNTGATSSSITATTTGKYLVVSMLNGCSSTDSINVTIKPLPAVNLGKDTSICANKTIQLIAAYTGASYAWNTGASSPSINVNSAGQYSVLNTLNGCNATDTINIAIQPAPLLELGADRSMCEYDTIHLDAFYPNATYTWSTGTNASSIVVSTAGKYSVISALSGCPALDSINIAFRKMPVANAGTDVIIPQNSTVQLNAMTHANNTIYLWSPGSSLSNPSIPNPIASPSLATEYTLKVTSTDGCIAEDKVMVNLQYPLIIPNAFSPNGDNINDKWMIGNIEFYPKCKVYIYNRYGQPVFLSDGYAKPWDGTNKGKVMETATYYYIIEVGDGRRSSGWVLLLR